MLEKTIQIHRKTNETDIQMAMNLYGSGIYIYLQRILYGRFKFRKRHIRRNKSAYTHKNTPRNDCNY